MLKTHPSYLTAFQSGKLKKTVEQAWQMLESCSICPRQCGVNRLKDQKGFCRTGIRAAVCSSMAHHGEEPPISGNRGSGTIFFTHCNMSCLYCQNYEFSQEGQGREVDAHELADIMLKLQNEGCHNINFVTPTHVMPQILKSLETAIEKGLKIPIVYNTGGYESLPVLKLLEGIVDIYLPDMRYGNADASAKFSRAPDYPRYNQEAVLEMHRQVGIAEMDEEGIIKKGLVIRHLVLPNRISGTKEIMRFIAQKISPETYISLMSQYLPYHKASGIGELSRRLTEGEYEEAKQIMEEFGLHNGWIQESFGLERFAGVHIKQNLLKDEE